MRRAARRWFLAGLLALVLGSSPARAAIYPEGFVEKRLVTGLTGATAMEVAPDGRIFVCEQTGALRVVKHDALLPRPFVTVKVDSSWERGLLGVAFDPDFAHTHHLYVNYISPDPYPHHRISRFTADGDVAVPGSEVVLFGGDDQRKLGGGIQNGRQGGAIHFGKDGKLYVAIGDQTAGAPAQDLHTLQGKMLRLNRDGSIPPDNPFYRTMTGKYRAIWALGLRNPFTFAVQPGTGRIFINDVGGFNETINEGVAGANYGWPTVDRGPTADPRFRGPLYWYRESSITGGTFYNPPVSQFPAEYVGKYFFNDFKAGWIKVIDPDHPSHVTDFARDVGVRNVVDLKVEADGSLLLLGRDAWVIDKDFRPHTGALYRLRYTGRKAPPVIAQAPAAQKVVAGGAAYFRVTASGSAPLRYRWQRDGKDMPGAADAMLVLPAVARADDGARFRCVVSNPLGETRSPEGTLTVETALPTPPNRPAAAVLMPPLPELAPRLLSQTGVFASLADLRPVAGLVPYEVNAPLWSDGAAKRRWIALPPGGRIDFAPAGEWTFSAGTVLVKHFDLPLDETRPGVVQRLETRLLVVDGTGLGYGVTYRWRPDHSDADLLTAALQEEFTIRMARGERKQTWTYPGPADCLACHTPAAKFVLGVKTRQLNRAGDDNPLRTWARLGMFRVPPDEGQMGHFSRLVAVGDRRASLEERVRSYLDSNCAHCHRPGNTLRANFDVRYDTPLAAQGILDVPTVSDSLGLVNPRLIAPGDVKRSMMAVRLTRTDGFHMPPLANSVPDREALAALREWIEGRPARR